MNEAKAERLLGAARIVLERFEAGHHPTFESLDRLRAAIDACDAMKMCGCLVDDDCDCELSPEGAKEGQ